MKTKKMQKLILHALCALCIGLLSVRTVYASDDAAETWLPVRQQFTLSGESAVPVRQIGIYELSSVDPSSPMPKGSQDGKYVFSLEGANTRITIPLSYTHAGIYRYALYQITEDAENYFYDRTRYTITVYIQNEPSGGLSSQLIAEIAGGEKGREAVFSNSYKDIDIPPEPPLTGETSRLSLWAALGTLSLITSGLLSGAAKRQAG